MNTIRLPPGDFAGLKGPGCVFLGIFLVVNMGVSQKIGKCHKWRNPVLGNVISILPVVLYSYMTPSSCFNVNCRHFVSIFSLIYNLYFYMNTCSCERRKSSDFTSPFVKMFVITNVESFFFSKRILVERIMYLAVEKLKTLVP